jgi:hypothetical protein
MKKIDGAARRRRKKVSRPVPRTYTLKRDDEDVRHSMERTVERNVESAEASALVQDMGRAFANTLDFYKSDWGGAASHEDAIAMTASMNEWRRSAIDGSPPEKVSWGDISALAQIDIADGLALWARVRESADDELESGRRAASIVGSRNDPFAVAQFLAIRDSFADQWQPNFGIETAMIDMMAVAFSLFLYWSATAHERAVEIHDDQRKEIEKQESRGWKGPYQTGADAVEQAHRLADGYNRQFLRVLRQLRDLRRYAPVIIQNNGGQVNVGAQQMNVKT